MIRWLLNYFRPNRRQSVLKNLRAAISMHKPTKCHRCRISERDFVALLDELEAAEMLVMYGEFGLKFDGVEFAPGHKLPDGTVSFLD